MYKSQYPVCMEPNGEGGYILTSRDVPEIISEIWDEKELEEYAVDALIIAADAYYEKKQVFPMPSKARKGEVLVDVPLSVFLKILLQNAMIEANIRPTDLANKMKLTPQAVNRIINLRHSTKVDTVQQALRSLGKEVQLSVA